VSYLLKTEGYDKVIKAVEAAVKDIDKSLVIEDLLNKANQQIALTATLRQKEFFMDIIKGKVGPDDVSHEQFVQFGIELDSEAPVLMMIGRIDNIPDKMSYTDKSRSILAIRLISEEFLQPLTVNLCISDEDMNMIWFLQPKKVDKDSAIHQSENEKQERTIIFVKGILELIQNSCHESLNLSVSFALNSQLVLWKDISGKYIFLKQLLDYRIGSGTGMLLVDKNMDTCVTGDVSPDQVYQPLADMRKLESLNIYLERGQRSEFFDLFDELTMSLRDVSSMHCNSALELYYSISLKFLSYINQWNLAEKIAFSVGLSKLTCIELHDSWKDAVDYLRGLADIIFDIQNHQQQKRALDTIAFIQKYIDDNISQELSLVKLADLVYFNPSYLSRLFKQMKGQNISEYILGKRIEKSKQLLENPDIKVLEVAEKVGYPIAQNFSRLFKKFTGMTPQEYRDVNTTGKKMI
jgi:two-component system response regulator YesN